MLVLAACSKAGDSAATTSGEHAWTQPGILRIAIARSPNTLNPVLAATTTESMIDRLIFDPLVSVEPDGKTLVPVLAAEVPTTANGEISKDGLTITYKLRSGVKWQDGAPFSSKDVKFTWQAMVNPANNVNSTTGYEDIKSVETPNDTTVVFHLKHKFAPFVETIFSESDDPINIIPEHLLGKYPDLNRVPFNESPVGTGAFKVARWVRGDHIELVANPDYFRGAPKLKQIIIREIPDENTEVNALRTHDIDWFFEPSPNLYLVLKQLPDITIHFVDQPQTLLLYMNNERPPFNDVRVRRAIAHAIDKQSLVEKFTGGSATVAQADQPPYSWAYDKNVTTYPFSVAASKALFKEAGYTPGPDGILQKNGKPLSLQLSTNNENATRRVVETQVQAMLHAVGVDVQIKNYPFNIMAAPYGQGGIQATGKYDMAISGWVAGLDPDDHSLYECDQIARPSHPDGTNYARYCSKAMDAAQEAALATYDQDKRKPAYDTIQKLIMQDSPEIVLWYARNPQATNPDFKGFSPNPVTESWNAYQWEI
jgi:peptide/nickel transport system substrate-binding protein